MNRGRLNHLSIRTKQTLIIMMTSSAVLLLACASFAIYDRVNFRRELVQNVSILADVTGNNCVAALDFNVPKTATESLAALRANDHIVAACVYAGDGKPFAVYQRDAGSLPVPPPAWRLVGEEFTPEQLHLFRPIRQSGEIVGAIFVASDLKELSARLWRYFGIVGIVLLAALLLALLMSSRLQRLISRPILELAQTARAVTLDKDYSARAIKQGNDELGQLVDGFNEMLAQIQMRDNALQTARDNLEERVRERSADLARTNKSLVESQALYHSLVEHLPAGVFRKDHEGRFVFVNSLFCRLNGMKEEEILGRTPRELALGGSPLAASGPSQMMRQSTFPAGGADEDELMLRTGEPTELEEAHTGLDGTLQYFQSIKSPVFSADESIIGSQGILFDITGRKRAEIELAYERDLLRTLLDNSPDQIYFKDKQSRFIKSSQAQAENFGVRSADQLVGRTAFDFSPEDLARPAFEDEQEIIRTGCPLIGKVEKEVLPDGRISWMLASKMPLRNKAGETIGTFGISKNITAMKETEEKLNEAHKQLLETSRKAGMAEVASNVLHNVGNVLNSVNVSATLVMDWVDSSKASSLAKVVALLVEHKGGLGAFFSDDPKGKALPGYLAQLSAHLIDEQAAMLKELASLRGNIEHIKEIVAMQQNYAKVSGVKEIIKIVDLVEDGLRMNLGSLARHGVEIVREYEDLPLMTVEKHKILQILVNLIRNAKYACSDSARVDKRVTVRITNGSGRTRISVADNGVGIPPENLALIFNHGFTTREGGHGFGLHSGALAAKEMGGSLSVQSGGPGLGAAFMLELPCQTEPTPDE